MKHVLFLILAASAAAAQTTKPVDSSWTFSACDKDNKPDGCMHVLTFRPTMSFDDYIDKDGGYHADFKDPNNEFRCLVTAYTESNPRNAMGNSEIQSVTITCSTPRKVETRK